MSITSFTQHLEMLACENRLFYKLSRLYYKSMVKREVSLAKITSHDHVLVVGGGPCPHSGIMIHQLTGAKVTIVDNDEKCVDCSSKFIADLGIADNVQIMLSDGADMDTGGYSVVHIAAQISPKEKTLQMLEKTACCGTRMLVRMPKNSLKRLYSPLEESHDARDIFAKHGIFGNVAKTVLHIIRGDIIESEAI